MNRTPHGGGNRPADYLYHAQHPSARPGRRRGDKGPARSNPPDSAFKRTLRTFSIVAGFMFLFFLLTIFAAVKSWQIRHSRVTRDLPPEDEIADFGRRATMPTSSIAVAAGLGSGDADTLQRAELLAQQAKNAALETNYTDAVRLYADALRIWPGLAAAQLELGRLHLQLRNYPKALVALERAAELHPTDPGALNDLACAHFLMQRFDRARAQLEAALRLQPDFAPALYNMALCRRFMGDPTGAQHALDEYLAIRPNDPYGLREKAFFLAAEGHYAGALEILVQVLDAKPDWAPPYFDAAASAALMQKTGDAINYLRKAESLTSPAAAYLLFQQPAFNEVRLSETGRAFQRELIRRAQSMAAPAAVAAGLTNPEPMLSGAAQ